MMRSTIAATCLVPLALAACMAARHGTVPGDDRAEPGTLPLAEIEARLAAPGAHEPFVPEAPLGITADLAALIPQDNPLTPAKVELGSQLYFDKRLSRDGTVSCTRPHDARRVPAPALTLTPRGLAFLGRRA